MEPARGNIHGKGRGLWDLGCRWGYLLAEFPRTASEADARQGPAQQGQHPFASPCAPPTCMSCTLRSRLSPSPQARGQFYYIDVYSFPDEALLRRLTPDEQDVPQVGTGGGGGGEQGCCTRVLGARAGGGGHCAPAYRLGRAGRECTGRNLAGLTGGEMAANTHTRLQAGGQELPPVGGRGRGWRD